MDYHIVNAACLKDYYVYLKFRDGLEGVVDLKPIAGLGEMFAPLKDQKFFCKMKLNERFGTVEWPNGSDLNPQSLHDVLLQAGGTVPQYRL